LDENIKKLNLTDGQKRDLVEFLKALDGTPIVVAVPTSFRNNIAVGQAILLPDFRNAQRRRRTRKRGKKDKIAPCFVVGDIDSGAHSAGRGQ